MAFIYMPFHGVEHVRGVQWLPHHAVTDKQAGGAEIPTEGQIWPRGDRANG